MLNKNWFYLILGAVIILTIYLFNKDVKSTITTDNNFNVSDTASVNKIFIADRSGATITLERVEKSWTVNNKYEVRKDAISTLLSTINQIRIQRPVSNKAFEGVIKNLATTGIKVEIYTNNDTPFKTYTIGSSTQNHLGTYMLLDGAATPFIIHIPSFNGFLSPRYGVQGERLNEKDWRATTVFKLKSEEIRIVKLNHIQRPEHSFTLTTKPMVLHDYKGNKLSFNQGKVLALLNSFKLLNCESFKDEKAKIEFATPLHELIVNNDTLRTYAIGDITAKNKEENFNVKRMFATLNNGELMLIQDYVFNKVLINIAEIKK
jgi:hypothetical protein